MADAAVTETLRTLEQRLLTPAVRASREQAGALLADDFFEIGRSGRTYDKQQMLDALIAEPLPNVPELRDFVARSLTPKDGNDPDAILSRAEAAIGSGDLNMALSELANLPEPARDAMTDWLGDAQIRLSVLEAVDSLSAKTN